MTVNSPELSDDADFDVVIEHFTQILDNLQDELNANN